MAKQARSFDELRQLVLTRLRGRVALPPNFDLKVKATDEGWMVDCRAPQGPKEYFECCYFAHKIARELGELYALYP